MTPPLKQKRPKVRRVTQWMVFDDTGNPVSHSNAYSKGDVITSKWHDEVVRRVTVLVPRGRKG